MLIPDVAAGVLLICFILTVSFENLVAMTIGAGVAVNPIVGLIWVVIFSITYGGAGRSRRIPS